MNQLTALAWKEWRESRIYLWIGLGILVGLPAVAEFEATFHTNHRFEFQAFSLVIALGGIMAVIVSVGSSCRDLHGHIEDFWRSRPVGVLQWWLIKYVVGFAIVVAMCGIPLVIESYFDRNDITVSVLAWYPTFWAAVYSIGFLAGCVVRRTAHAATLALAGLLLLQLAPVIFPPLAWLNPADFSDSRALFSNSASVLMTPAGVFALGMTGLAIVGLALAIVAIRFDWHVRSGRKMMYGLVAAALLLLFASAAFQLATNMPVLQRISLGEHASIRRVECNGTHGFILSDSPVGIAGNWQPQLRTFEITPNGIVLGSPGNITRDQYSFLYLPSLEVRPNVGYRVYSSVGGTDNEFIDTTLQIADPRNGSHLREMRINHRPKPPGWVGQPKLFAWKDRLFVMGNDFLITLDITDANAPKVLSTVPFVYSSDGPAWETNHDSKYEYGLELAQLPALPGVPPIERLRAAISRGFVFDGQMLCIDTGQGVASYRLSKLTDREASFTAAGRYNRSMLQSMFGTQGFHEMILDHGLLYSTETSNGSFGNGISVYDTHGTHPLAMIGHFAAPEMRSVCPLGDGRAIAVGEQTIWLIGPPPRR